MEDSEFQRIAKALADPSRFELLQQVAASAEEIACTEINASSNLTKATLSHHLKELADSGLIEVRRESRFMYLRLHRPTLDRYLRALRSRLSK